MRWRGETAGEFPQQEEGGEVLGIPIEALVADAPDLTIMHTSPRPAYEDVTHAAATAGHRCSIVSERRALAPFLLQ